jgi:hypothetical protein
VKPTRVYFQLSIFNMPGMNRNEKNTF